MTRKASTCAAFDHLLILALAGVEPVIAPLRDESARTVIPSHIAEDDRLRSLKMRQLILEESPNERQLAPTRIPKVLIQFWHDISALPSDVLECIDSWKPLENQGFKRILFDDFKARRFIFKHFGRRYVTAFDQCHHPAMRCDYFRLCYMVRHGGFYVDADEFYQGGDCEYLFHDSLIKIQPLCYDIADETMVPVDIFTKKQNDSPLWIFYVNNNPIIAPADHPVTRLALSRSTELLLSDEGKPLDIQSTTGPGNLTASLVKHAVASALAGRKRDFSLLDNWGTISVSRWPLSYRNDERNWRLWNPME